MTFEERCTLAESLGYKVVDVEHYNPGGTYYVLTLIAPDGTVCGKVQKTVETRSLGKTVKIVVPDENAEAWRCLETQS